MKLKYHLLALLGLMSLSLSSFGAEEEKVLSGQIEDRLAEAQERLLQAQGSYRTIKMQEDAIENMRKATRLSLKAANLRAKAEKLQRKADVLVNKANVSAVSRGLYITNPLAPIKMEPPPPVVSKHQSSPVTPPVPGEPINITIPSQPEVTYKQEEDSASDGTATINNF